MTTIMSLSGLTGQSFKLPFMNWHGRDFFCIMAIMKKFLPLFAIFLFFAACASHPQIDPDLEDYLYPEETYLPENLNWQPVCPGIARLDFENPEFPLVYHAVRVELNTPGLQIVTFPDYNFAKDVQRGRLGPGDAGVIPQPFIYRSHKTERFAKESGAVVAMNATPFGGRNGKWDLAAKLGAVRQLVGLHIENGNVIAAPVERYAALIFKRADTSAGAGYIAEVLDNQTAEGLQGADFAFGGFFTVLRDGEVCDFKVRTHDSRSGAGISQDGRTLYLLAVEGEMPGKSQGLSYPQCGRVFKALGCDDALEFDGGSSTQLFINGKNALNYRSVVVQGNSFGFLKK